MADYTVLSEVGQSLISVLESEMSADTSLNALMGGTGRISLQSPAELEGDDTVRLSIYLYRIVEDSFRKNRPLINDGSGQLQLPPLTLDLHYLITPLLGEPADQQTVLGKAMQVFYDHSTLEGTDLPDPPGSLKASGEVARIILNPVTLEETTRVWQALEMSYRLSVCYTVRVAMIASRRKQQTRPVVVKSAQYAQWEQP